MGAVTLGQLANALDRSSYRMMGRGMALSQARPTMEVSDVILQSMDRMFERTDRATRGPDR